MIDFIIIICLNYKIMITDADIKKMKSVFATKDDFAAIQGMFDSSRKETNERFRSMDERFDSLSDKVERLAISQEKNTEDLIELITTGFNSYEKRIERIEEKAFKAN